MNRPTAAPALLCAVLLASCMSPVGAGLSEQRNAVNRMCRDTLEEIYQANPKAKADVVGSVGYAVFDDVERRRVVSMAGRGTGYGVAIDQKTGKRTYMRMTHVTTINVGVVRYRMLIVFHDEKLFRQFVEQGVLVGGAADAASDRQGVVAVPAVGTDAVRIYREDAESDAAQKIGEGTMFWPDPDFHK